MGRVYYNEFDKKKAAWLRQLIEEGAIADGIVDERSITDIEPDDLRGFVQCHFFAGIGLWSLCLRRAGWPDDRPVWTGSCPCGPFSSAGLRKGFEDPRHLWPAWFRLIRERRPVVLFGEQSDQALAWLDLVSSDLEGAGYAIGSAVIPAAGFRGAHGRHRIGFVADADNTQWWSERAPWHDGFWPKTGRVEGYGHLGDGGAGVSLADAANVGWGEECPHIRRRRAGDRAQGLAARSDASGHAGGLDDAAGGGRGMGSEGFSYIRQPDSSGLVDWLLCRDSRWRPVEPGLSPLVDESPARMVRLRGYGDGIDCAAFTQFIAAYMEVAP